MPLWYEEGESKAFSRLQEEVFEISPDGSILAWETPSLWSSGMLARSPANFTESGKIVTIPQDHFCPPYSLTNRGLEFAIPFTHAEFSETIENDSQIEFAVPIACAKGSNGPPLAIFLQNMKRYRNQKQADPVSVMVRLRWNEFGSHPFETQHITPITDECNFNMMRTDLDEMEEYRGPPSYQQAGFAHQRIVICNMIRL